MKKLLIILLLIVGCENSTEAEDVVIPSPSVICENNYSEVDGSLTSCGSGCLGAEGGCYLQNDIDVLADIIELDSLDIPYLQLGSQSWIQGRLISLDGSNVYPNLDTLPNTISNLTALTTLDLRYNNLTTLPNTICDIYDSLATIQLKSNHICPPYPECITDEDLDYQYQNDCESMGCMDNTACNYDGTVLYSYLNDACWDANEGCDCSFPQFTEIDCGGECG